MNQGQSSDSVAVNLEAIDQKLLELMGKHANLIMQSAAGAAGHRDVSHERDEGNEAARIVKLVAAHDGPLKENCVKAVFRELYSGCRQLIQPIRVAYLGPAYSYSHLAVTERFGESVELAPVATIAAVFEEVSRGQADYGLVPIENSTDGRIADSLDMFARTPVRICGEVQLNIHHCLLGKCSRSEVQEVYSKPQALSQCRGWLAKHLPSARTVETASTAGAAQLAAEKPGAAGIASRQAGAKYGLEVIAANIEDNRNNVTRFAVIGDRPAPRTGDDKTSLMFEIPHRPGALADAMEVFKRNRLNLTWIESFPLPGSKHGYLFFVEFEGHLEDSQTKVSLAALRAKTIRLEILGSCAKSPPVD